MRKLLVVLMLVFTASVMGCIDWPLVMGAGTSTATNTQKEKVEMRKEAVPKTPGSSSSDNVSDAQQMFNYFMQWSKESTSTGTATTAPVSGSGVKSVDTSAPKTSATPAGGTSEGGSQSVENEPVHGKSFAAFLALILVGGLCGAGAIANWWFFEDLGQWKETLILLGAGILDFVAAFTSMSNSFAWVVIAGTGAYLVYFIYTHFNQLWKLVKPVLPVPLP